MARNGVVLERLSLFHDAATQCVLPRFDSSRLEVKYSWLAAAFEGVTRPIGTERKAWVDAGHFSWSCPSFAGSLKRLRLLRPLVMSAKEVHATRL
jgi:hypothetical protein